MENGFFRMINRDGTFGIEIYAPVDGGSPVMTGEITEYLSGLKIDYNEHQMAEKIKAVKDREYIKLGDGLCPRIPEGYQVKTSDDAMRATVRFVPASEGAPRMGMDDFLRDMKMRNITYGIKKEELSKHFYGPGIYCTDILFAEGQAPVQGTDARIEYNFDVNPDRHPKVRKDGSVDYFQLTTINHCHKGEELARIIPEKPGIEGSDIYGQTIKPRDVKRETLKFGHNIELSEDRKIIRSMVDGYVSLVEDKVFVSDIYSVKNVDVSTGNLEFEGSIEISGDVAENFTVRAGGDVVVNGQVEGATIIAGGNIVIAKGMNGMSKGVLQAGGSVVVRYLENVNVCAGEDVSSEAILHCNITAGNEVRVDGRRGVIIGGTIQAGISVVAKTIGASMGANTVLEIGVNTKAKADYAELQKRMAGVGKTVRDAETILANFKDKLKKGIKFTDNQVKYMKTVASMYEEKSTELARLKAEEEGMKDLLRVNAKAEVIVNNEVFPGTTIVIGDVSKTLQTGYHYCKFVREHGEVCVAAL